MKLGLVGANGSVGTELCFLLMDDVKLKPIIRNKLSNICKQSNCLISEN